MNHSVYNVKKIILMSKSDNDSFVTRGKMQTIIDSIVMYIIYIIFKQFHFTCRPVLLINTLFILAILLLEDINNLLCIF